MNQITLEHQNLDQKINFSLKKIFKIQKNIDIFLTFFVKHAITFFGAIRRDNEENKKDAPKHQLSIYVFKIFRTFLEQKSLTI